jgi:hypothetical protein
MDILVLKLKQDCKQALTKYATSNNYPESEIDSLIESYVNPSLFNFKKKEINPCKCQARKWDKGEQCTNNKTDDSDYCGTHLGTYLLYGTLRFGDMREPKPKYDLIKLSKGIKEKLNWVHPDPLIRLQNVLDKQQKKIIEDTPKSIVH